MRWLIEPRNQSSLPVMGIEGRFAVGNIFCVGRNYADHAVEMGGDPVREPPFFFIKPSFTLLEPGYDMVYPDHSTNVHHEVELVVALGRSGRRTPVEGAMELVYGYAVGIDMTRRDLQSAAKEKRQPWEAGKSFVHAAPCSAITPVREAGLIEDAMICLSVNEQVRQSGFINQMIWKIPEIISRLSDLFPLNAGDLIYTGTPAGVGPIEIGDELQANISGLSRLTFKITVPNNSIS